MKHTHYMVYPLYKQVGYTGCTFLFDIRGYPIKQAVSFLVVSSSFPYSRRRKRGGNKKKTGFLIQLGCSTK